MKTPVQSSLLEMRSVNAKPPRRKVARKKITLCALAPLRLCVKDIGDKALEWELRRAAHPEVPRDVWTGCEEAEDGRDIEIRDGHFERRQFDRC
jgi:hypothetical protein